MIITGKNLIEWGYKTGNWFPEAIKAVNEAHTELLSFEDVKKIISMYVPPDAISLRSEPLPYYLNIVADNDTEEANIASVQAHMNELMRVPTVRYGAVMPDACPSDKRLGYIPVGAVVATENAIHPGMHSADICCSMAITIFDDCLDRTSTAMLDAGMKLSHFGPGGRARGQQIRPETRLLFEFENNSFLNSNIIVSAAIEHFATQGDGNHFFYVGRIKSTGQIALITHHGSRKPGAILYKAGMVVANKTRMKLSPETPDYNGWIIADSKEGDSYWRALQLIREWTKQSHFAIHDLIANHLGLHRTDRFWNEHNFVFQKSDGLFYHAKGATPAYSGYAHDDVGLTLIPLNMAEPILITSGLNAANGLGFSPHGAGRNFSRTAHMKTFGERTEAEVFASETIGIDARSFCGNIDLSELPSAYKNANSVRSQIDKFGMANVEDIIEPLGNIMAGDWQRDAPWRNKKK